MQEYIIEFKNAKGNIKVGYNEKGNLVSVILNEFEAPNSISDDWIWTWIPTHLRQLQSIQNDKVKITFIPTNLSFDAFWEKYDYKVGKKDRARNLWNNMNEQERIKCLQQVPKYKAWLSGKSYDRAYPETFLSQRRWEGVYN